MGKLAERTTCLNINLHRAAAAVVLTFLSLPSGIRAQQWTPRGITEPFKDATLSATVSGPVAAIRKREGETVRQGEVILELEKEQETLEVERRRLIADSQVEVEAARNRVRTLQGELAASRRLFEATQSVSREELLQKELESRLAEAELERLMVAERREQLEYRIAAAQLQQRQIVAPFDGVIVEILPEVGESCSPQQPLVRIADVGRCRLIVHLEAAAARDLSEGRPVQLRIEGARPPNVFSGVVEYVSPVVEPSSGLRKVKVLFDNPDRRVQPGLSGTMLVK